MKKLAAITMFVAVTGLCFADNISAQSDSQDQYGEDQSGSGSSQGGAIADEISFDADQNFGVVGMQVSYADDPFLVVLLMSTSQDRFMIGDDQILAGARLAGWGQGTSAGYAADLDLSGSDYEGSLWVQAIVFAQDGSIHVSDIKELSLGENQDRTDPDSGPTDPDGDGGSAGSSTEPAGSDENQNAGLETGNGDKAGA